MSSECLKNRHEDCLDDDCLCECHEDFEYEEDEYDDD
jgi:hypothetical protein